MSNFTDFTSHFRVLGGIVLILLIVALSTCIKNRRHILLVSTSLIITACRRAAGLELTFPFNFLWTVPLIWKRSRPEKMIVANDQCTHPTPFLPYAMSCQEPTATYGHQESFARQILIDHIRHLSQTRRDSDDSTTASSHLEVNNSPPPSYDDVVKVQGGGGWSVDH